jgi:hypothetical protein
MLFKGDGTHEDSSAPIGGGGSFGELVARTGQKREA